MPAKKKARAGEVQLYVGTRKGAFIFRSDRRRKSRKIGGPHFPGWERGSAEFRFAETLRFVLRESRRLRRTRSLRDLSPRGEPPDAGALWSDAAKDRGAIALCGTSGIGEAWIGADWRTEEAGRKSV